MSIIITNISDTYSREGIQTYRISLNNIPLTTFEHMSEDGMAKCLLLASEALDKVDIDVSIDEYRKEQYLSFLKEANKLRGDIK